MELQQRKPDGLCARRLGERRVDLWNFETKDGEAFVARSNTCTHRDSEQKWPTTLGVPPQTLFPGAPRRCEVQDENQSMTATSAAGSGESKALAR